MTPEMPPAATTAALALAEIGLRAPRVPSRVEDVAYAMTTGEILAGLVPPTGDRGEARDSELPSIPAKKGRRGGPAGPRQRGSESPTPPPEKKNGEGYTNQDE